jgi:hypothetical protein
VDVIEIAVADVEVTVELELVVLAATVPVFDTSPIMVISEGDPTSLAWYMDSGSKTITWERYDINVISAIDSRQVFVSAVVYVCGLILALPH